MGKRVTRNVEMSGRAIAEGIFTLPDGVTYLSLLGHSEGEFPHAHNPEGCDAALHIHLKGRVLGKDLLDPWCTREAEHEGPHVAHIYTGTPIAAWTDQDDTKEKAA